MKKVMDVKVVILLLSIGSVITTPVIYSRPSKCYGLNSEINFKLLSWIISECTELCMIGNALIS